MDNTLRLLGHGIDQGLHIGYQLYVEQGGRVIADVAAGEARPGVAMDRDTIMLWLSSGKPVTAVAVAQQVERSRLDLDQPVARWIPAFAAGGKESITPTHLLTHTSGFRAADTGWPGSSWEDTIQRICAARLEPRWTIGDKAGYHPGTSWFILAELVRRFDGRPFASYVREEIFLPLGMGGSWIGMDPDAYATHRARLGQMQNTARTPPSPYPGDASAAGITAAKPGGNARGPIRELGRFYRALLRGGEPLLRPETVQHITARHREGTHDATFRHTMDWGLGFMVNSNHHGVETVPYSFGRHASMHAFGHGGAESSIGFADPAHDLVVAWVCNGMPGPQPHHQRNLAINTTIYEDLGLI